MAELMYGCNMCSYEARSLNKLTSHVCKIHRYDSRFHFYCKSCLRSYTKWDSYRKHLQRGCTIIPGSSVVDHASSSIITPPVADDISMDEEELPPGCCNDAQDWYEAAYVLKIKEQHILSQVAVDQIVSYTRTLVSDILNKTLNDVQDFLPANAL